jgi:hypothetical protein
VGDVADDEAQPAEQGEGQDRQDDPNYWRQKELPQGGEAHAQGGDETDAEERPE